MQRALALVLALACPLAAHGADTLPVHIAGSWGTAASLYAGDSAQNLMHLRADGYGMMAGSAPPAKRLDGDDDGKPAPRAVIGFPVRAALDGDMLTVHPFLPEGASADAAAQAARVAIACRYAAADPTLTCTGPDGTPFVLRRLGATLAPDVAAAIDAVKPQAERH